MTHLSNGFFKPLPSSSCRIAVICLLLMAVNAAVQGYHRSKT
uniref:Secreted protein n=1 Tax=Heterorhabditis bacteriophora TaxID=37862 RepID=A0A1I7WJW1_HETBA